MPWKDKTAMEQKIEFICEWRTGRYTITELCRAFKISRPTAYRLIERFENQGYEGLKEESRAPRNHPNSTDKKVVEGILKLKAKHVRWGAKKIRILLFNDFTEDLIPSPSTTPAYIDEINGENWIGIVKNEKLQLAEFYAIDNCPDVIKNYPANESRCDGVLVFSNNLIFVELKSRKKRAWFAKGREQLTATIKIFLSEIDVSHYQSVSACVCNNLRPRATTGQFRSLKKTLVLFSEYRIDLTFRY